MRIFIADADRELRVALQMLLHQEPGMHVTGMAVRAEGLAEQVLVSRPDVLLVDWYLPDGSLVTELAELSRSDRCPLIIVMSVHAETAPEAMAVGADLFVAKNAPPIELVRTLRSVEVTSSPRVSPPTDEGKVKQSGEVSNKRKGE
jgi:DNA-binding NarL/FixJ family response regulator